ncbi:MAG: DJ-1/PfpI family protein [Candidatus Falkowbacteria bacterium]
MKKIILYLSLALLVSGCGVTAKPDLNKTGNTPSPKALIVIAPAEFADNQFEQVTTELNRLKIGYDIVSIQGGTAVSDQGKKQTITITAGEVKPDNYCYVLFLGGAAMAHIAEDDTLRLLAEEFARAGKPIGAIENGMAVLANTSLISKKHVANLVSLKPVLEKAGGILSPESVFTDGLLVTASTAEHSSDVVGRLGVSYEQSLEMKVVKPVKK